MERLAIDSGPLSAPGREDLVHEALCRQDELRAAWDARDAAARELGMSVLYSVDLDALPERTRRAFVRLARAEVARVSAHNSLQVAIKAAGE